MNRMFERITTTALSIIMLLLLLMNGSSTFAQTVPADSSAQAASSSAHAAPDSLLSLYNRYPFVRFVGKGERPVLTDREFYEMAAKVIFPVNQFALPKNDTLLLRLKNEVLPLANENRLKLVGLMIRGAASPEGDTRHNEYLGKARADNLLRFFDDHLLVPFDTSHFYMQASLEDYRYLCYLMKDAGDKDYRLVQGWCDQYLPKDQTEQLKCGQNLPKNQTEQLKRDQNLSMNQTEQLKQVLKTYDGGRLWQRLLHDYYPALRAARVVSFFEDSTKVERMKPVPVASPDSMALAPVVWEPQTETVRLPRREYLSVKTNLLFDVAYMPGYNRWCPIPNIAVEYYPLRGHFTFGGSVDFPWWQHYPKHKFFQVRNYQFESRYYFKANGANGAHGPNEAYEPNGANEPHKPHKPYAPQTSAGPAFRGLYLQAYVHTALFGICFDADRGWEGEGFGGGVGIGYVLPLSRRGHWRLEFGAQFGIFVCRYDPYQYESPVDDNLHDNLYYYKYYGEPKWFKTRQHQTTWFGPTRIGITLSYDLFYRRIQKKGISMKPWETYERILKKPDR